VSSRYSHIVALLQSRLTVTGETYRIVLPRPD